MLSISRVGIFGGLTSQLIENFWWMFSIHVPSYNINVKLLGRKSRKHRSCFVLIKNRQICTFTSRQLGIEPGTSDCVSNPSVIRSTEQDLSRWASVNAVWRSELPHHCIWEITELWSSGDWFPRVGWDICKMLKYNINRELIPDRFHWQRIFLSSRLHYFPISTFLF